MKDIDFIDKYGTFRIKNPENYSGLYLRLQGKKGLNQVLHQLSAEIVKQARIPFFWNLLV